MIIAIDPGITGGIAVLHDDGNLHVVGDMPVQVHQLKRRRTTRIDPEELHDVLAAWPDLEVVVEEVHAHGNGTIASFSLGFSYGTILAVCRLQGRTVHTVPPTVWKKALGLTRAKKAALLVARTRWGREHFPLEKHDGRAEAALIGWWFLQEVATPSTFPSPAFSTGG